MDPFGGSVVGLVAVIKVTTKVGKAFKDKGGAASRYAQSENFLTGLRITLEHLRRYAESKPDSTYTDDLEAQIKHLEAPWNDFKAFLDKYEKALGNSAQGTQLGKAPRTVRWTLKDLSGEIDKLEAAIAKPLQIINSLLSLQSLEALEKLPEQLLSADQCRQLLDAIHLAQVPAGLELRVGKLEQMNGERQDAQGGESYQLGHVAQCLDQFRDEIKETLKEDWEGWRDTSEAQLEAVKERIDRLHHKLSETETKALMESQQTMIMTMRVALEAKIKTLQDSLETRKGDREDRDLPATQSTTSATMWWAAILFSSLMSGVTAASIVGRSADVKISEPSGHSSPSREAMTLSEKHHGSSLESVAVNAASASKESLITTPTKLAQPRSVASGPSNDAHIHAASPPFRAESPGPGPIQRRRQPVTDRLNRHLPSDWAGEFHGQFPAPLLPSPRSHTSSPPPSLSNYSEATPTETSVCTSLASRFSGVSLLQENDQGVLESRMTYSDSRKIFICTFWFLGCKYVSSELEEWKTHCLAHFLGHPPLRTLLCPFCTTFETTHENGHAAWDVYIEHLASHYRSEQTLRCVRKDQKLYQYLWQKRIIGNHELKELRTGQHGSNVVFNDPSNKERQMPPRAVPATNPSRSSEGPDGDADDDGSDNDTLVAPPEGSDTDSRREPEHEDDNERGPHNKNGRDTSDLPKRPRYIIPSKLEFVKIKKRTVRKWPVEIRIADAESAPGLISTIDGLDIGYGD